MKHYQFWILICLSLGLSACNTIQGAGKDVEKVGQSIEKAAK